VGLRKIVIGNPSLDLHLGTGKLLTKIASNVVPHPLGVMYGKLAGKLARNANEGTHSQVLHLHVRWMHPNNVLLAHD